MGVAGKILKIAGIAIICIAISVVTLITVGTIMLTPERLSRIVSKEASRYLKANVRVENVRFTFWSTFPHLTVHTDSISVQSRTLSGLEKDVYTRLPVDATQLMEANSLTGDLNILSLLSDCYRLRNIRIKGLKLNLVTVNDSVSNFDIFPPTDSNGGMPETEANSINIERPWSVKFFNMPTSTYVCADMDDATLKRIDNRDRYSRKDRDKVPPKSEGQSGKKTKGEFNYNLAVKGKLTLATSGLSVLRDFPFEMDGRVDVGFRPIYVSLTDYAINLGNIKGKLNMAFSGGQDMSINNLRFDISRFNPNKLITYLPEDIRGKLRPISYIDADLDMDISARIDEPYHLSSANLPSVEVDFNVAPGEIHYSLSPKNELAVTSSEINAIFFYNGSNPSISRIVISPFSISSEGVTCRIKAEADSLFNTPEVHAEITAEADIHKLLHPFLPNPGTKIKGSLRFISNIYFNITNFINNTNITNIIRDIKMSGNLYSDRLSVDSRARHFNLYVDSTAIGFRAELPELMSATFPAKFTLRGNSISLRMPHTEINLNQFDMIATASRFRKREKTIQPVRPQITSGDSDDARTLQFANHTPESINLRIPEKYIKAITSLNLQAKIQADRGVIKTPSFPVPNRFSNLKLTANADSVALHSLNLRSLSSGISLNGTVSNLRQFLTSATPAILKIDLNADIDTLDINQLANIYAHGRLLHGDTTFYDRIKDMPVTASDSTALLLPRNILAKINFHADESIYTNLHLYNIDGGVMVKDGDLKISNLHIGTDFGEAFLNIGYKTADIQRMGLNLEAEMKDIDVVRFFKSFKKLLAMMPEMKNLSGFVGIRLNGGMDLFPTMYANLPSLQADLDIRGDSLTVHQSKFIRCITRMMMIKTAEDIHINNLDVRASIHDNLIELYPFDFIFNRYHLSMAGTNNFSGDLYYHIAVDKSPMPIPFAINIIGTFSHPKLRFGGVEFKTREAEKITENIMERNSFNLMKEIKRYFHLFIQKAAKSDDTAESEFSDTITYDAR